MTQRLGGGGPGAKFKLDLAKNLSRDRNPGLALNRTLNAQSGLDDTFHLPSGILKYDKPMAGIFRGGERPARLFGDQIN